MSIQVIQQRHRRTAILRLLNDQAGGGTVNESIIIDALPAYGVTATRDQIRGDLAWLEEQFLMGRIPGEVADLFVVSTRGREVAQGKVSHPGIALATGEEIMAAAAATAKHILDR